MGRRRRERRTDRPGRTGAAVASRGPDSRPVPEPPGICVVCRTGRDVRRFHMTHRVAVQLCAAHRDLRYLCRDAGREFTDRLETAWRSLGAATPARRAALRAHRRRYGTRRPAGDLPGSYGWPGLRREAEDRFAEGEAPDTVITDLRRRHAADHASAPSVQTIRRWFREARWTDRPTAPRTAARGGEPIGDRTGREEITAPAVRSQGGTRLGDDPERPVPPNGPTSRRPRPSPRHPVRRIGVDVRAPWGAWRIPRPRSGRPDDDGDPPTPAGPPVP